MRTITSLPIEKKIFNKLVKIGFIATDDFKFGYIPSSTHDKDWSPNGFLFKCEENVNYQPNDLQEINVQFVGIERQMFSKLIKLGLIKTFSGEKKNMKSAKCKFSTNKYDYTGWLLGKFYISTKIYESKKSHE